MVKNDPMKLICKAFLNLYPDKNFEIFYSDSLIDCKGAIVFPNDGNISQIYINIEIPIWRIGDILVHELSHLAMGKECGDHNAEFDQHYDAILVECQRLHPGCISERID